MNIWIIKTGEQTEYDNNARFLRSGQIFQFFKKKGVRVTWFNSTFNHQIKKQRFDKTISLKSANCKIIYLYGNSYENNISFKRFKSQIINAFEFFKFIKNKKYQKPDLIISNYPTVELSLISCIFAKKNKIPYLIDVRDMWPDIILNNLSVYKKIFFYPIFLIWNQCFRYCLKNSSSIISISDNFLNWTLKKAKIIKNSSHKYFYLTKQLKKINNFNCDVKLLNFLNDKKKYTKIIYCGSISKRHDFKTTFDALKETKNKKIIVLICGKGTYFNELRYKFKNVKNLHFLGWMNDINLNLLLSSSDYGLLPYNSIDFEMSYPNKLSEYLSNNLKIISCIDGITRKLIKNENIGYTYNYKSKNSLLKIFDKIKKKKDVNSITLYKNMFCYDKIMNSFYLHVKKIIEKNSL
jgi:hypothetical protein